jgi:AraC-like DNA-binding protein
MDLSGLKGLLVRYNAGSSHEMPGLSVFVREAPGNIEAFIYEPVLCLILQGSKTTSVGDQTATLMPGDALVVSHALPVVSQITTASPKKPYLALILFLDLSLLRGLLDAVADMSVPRAEARSLAVAPAEAAWLEPLVRYAELASSPMDARVLGPSVLREIYYRLLLSQAGGMLWSLLNEDSHASRIARAINRLRSGYRMPLRIAELARTAAMSASSFHQHFRAVTGTTPLQYQKDLRLIEAHGLMTAMTHNVSQAAFAVGYESPNQFSRDYSRKFGVAPSTGASVRAARFHT